MINSYSVQRQTIMRSMPPSTTLVTLPTTSISGTEGKRVAV